MPPPETAPPPPSDTPPAPWKVRILADMQAAVEELRKAGEDPQYAEWVRARYLAVLEQADNDPLVDQMDIAVRSLAQQVAELRALAEETRGILDSALAEARSRAAAGDRPVQRGLFS